MNVCAVDNVGYARQPDNGERCKGCAGEGLAEGGTSMCLALGECSENNGAHYGEENFKGFIWIRVL